MLKLQCFHYTASNEKVSFLAVPLYCFDTAIRIIFKHCRNRLSTPAGTWSAGQLSYSWAVTLCISKPRLPPRLVYRYQPPEKKPSVNARSFLCFSWIGITGAGHPLHQHKQSEPCGRKMQSRRCPKDQKNTIFKDITWRYRFTQFKRKVLESAESSGVSTKYEVISTSLQIVIVRSFT